ncbi:hypothetical protein AB0O31_22155 [Kitasatospora cineracea]|uniref:hypothetical protein n=1 Tax=Kitasatospora cineracea TaxID=88074 RepID=UPI003439F103
MSGSPMYSAIGVGAAVRAAQAAQQRARQAERRRREQDRARERARLAAERAAGRAAGRAARERRDRARIAEARRRAEERTEELARRDGAEREQRLAAFTEHRRTAVSRGLDDVARLLTEVRGQADPQTVFDLDGRLSLLRSRLKLDPDPSLGAATEELRGRVVALRRAAPGAESTDRPGQLADLEQRLESISPTGDGPDAAGRAGCAQLLDRMRGALGEGQELRFDALLGTAEHELARHAVTVARAEAERRARHLAETESRTRLAVEAESAAELERLRAVTAAEQAAARLAEQLLEAGQRFAVVAQGTRNAVQDAAELGEPTLHEQLLGLLGRVEAALAEGRGEPALAAVAELEVLLPDAEERLDDLLAAHEQRTELARVLQDAMAAAGLGFAGFEDRGQDLVLHFDRAGGATYEATLRHDAAGTPVLSYVVEGEPDRTVLPATGEITCDRTEALLDHVHRLMADDDYHPGELDWDGKPPPSGAAFTRAEWRTR